MVLIGLPLIEISIFAEVGAEIGGLMTVLLTVLTAAIGVFIVRLQGLIVLSRARENLMNGEPLVGEVIHGMFLFLAGILLLVPGFLTDAIGAILLIPFVRTMLGRIGFAHVIVGNPKPEPQYDAHGNVIIEGQYRICEDETDEKPDNKTQK